MEKVNWKVQIRIVSSDPQATKQKAAEHVDNFGVQAEAHDFDGVMRAARAWLGERKYTIRALNFVAPTKLSDPPPRELIAYVLPPRA